MSLNHKVVLPAHFHRCSGELADSGLFLQTVEYNHKPLFWLFTITSAVSVSLSACNDTSVLQILLGHVQVWLNIEQQHATSTTCGKCCYSYWAD